MAHADENRQQEEPTVLQTLPVSLRRRTLLSGAVAAGGLLAAPALRAQTGMSPDAALEHMMQGNRRFVAEKMTSFDEDLTILKQHTVDKQEPLAAVLSCADSRVPVELVFDQSIGHLFVTRVAGNVCTPEIIASLEYGAAVLGVVAIMVLGHSGCGAVQATIEGKAVPGQISALYAPIRPAVQQAGGTLAAATKANAQIQAGLLRTASPVLAELIGKGRLKVVAGYYDLGSGAVTLLS
ncbi:MAG: carbonic anhydrase [Proteobacteria bacterium]|nr:carbonic anhydrase [Pseudomonadota bacterium]